MVKSRNKILRLYQEDASGRLLFKRGDTRTLKELRAIFYERVLRRREQRRKGLSFRIDIKHPIKRLPRRSFMGQLLLDKRKFRFFYGNMREYQLRNIFYKAFKKTIIFQKGLLNLFEARIDSLIFRLNFQKSLNTARQHIKHHGILSNYRRINWPGTKLAFGDLLHFDSYSQSYFSIVIKREYVE